MRGSSAWATPSSNVLGAGVWALLLEHSHPRLATDVFYVAGDRVVSDPLCKPFSMGRSARGHYMGFFRGSVRVFAEEVSNRQEQSRLPGIERLGAAQTLGWRKDVKAVHVRGCPWVHMSGRPG